MFQKFENDEMKSLNRVIGGACQYTYDANCNETDSVDLDTVGKRVKGSGGNSDDYGCDVES